jgi:predicted 3-demethylubiquinone-9 3-methyltransferase (glyoxalase superfamily)
MTAPSVATCLWFDHQAEEAARLYCSLIPGSAISDIFRQNGNPQNPAFLVEFHLAGQAYQAMNGGPHYTLSPAASIVVQIDSQAELDHLWDALLADGGRESRCGWLTDRFGLSWQIIPRSLPRLIKADRSGRVLQAMTQMVRIDIAGLEAAARG